MVIENELSSAGVYDKVRLNVEVAGGPASQYYSSCDSYDVTFHNKVACLTFVACMLHCVLLLENNSCVCLLYVGKSSEPVQGKSVFCVM